MRFPTEGQFLELLACIFGGIVIGIIYDITHFTGVPKIKKWVLPVLDILFVVLAAAVFLFVTYMANFGEVRFYSVAGFAAGFIAERFSIKILVAKAVGAVYNNIVKIKNKLRARQKPAGADVATRSQKKSARQKRKNDRVTI